MTDALEAVGQHVQEEPAHELVGGERHASWRGAVAIILPGETDRAAIHADQSMIGNGDPVRVPAQVGQCLGRPGEGALGEHNPFGAAQRRQHHIEFTAVGEWHQFAEETHLASAMDRRQLVKEQAAIEPRKHAHGQKEAGTAGDPSLAIGRYPTARDNAVDVGMVRQRLPPCVQHHRRADLGAETSGIAGNRAQRFGCSLEQHSIKQCLVLAGDGRDRCRQGEHDMEIRDRQQIVLASCKPVMRGIGLAIATVSRERPRQTTTLPGWVSPARAR